MSESAKSLFNNLGKPTLRGIRKCPKCGTLNGTRGMSCKNKDCGQIFKPAKDKNMDLKMNCVKLICNLDLEIYSVKIVDNGFLRCFVHLPILEGIEVLNDVEEIKVIKQSAATCSACKKHLGDVGTITLNLNPCIHTNYIVDCPLEAEPLEIKREIVRVFPFSEEMRQEIYTMLSQTEDHLVQRLTKNTLVVRCVVNGKNPLGLLHFSIFQPVKLNAKKIRIMCDCQSEYTKPFVPKENQMCLHFYLCMCAFASDVKLLEEFKTLIQSVLKIKSPDIFETSTISSEPDDLKILQNLFSYTSVKKRKIDNENIIATEEVNAIKTAKNFQKSLSSTNQNPDFDEISITVPSIDFDQWLASVTECINQTMHYQFNGSPEPLLFHVPQSFFDILQQKISAGTKKKRLPSNVVAFTRKTSSPVGTFSKYTWHITNVLHVKRIFDTELVSLELTRNFIKNRDGTYTACNPSVEDAVKLAENLRKTSNKSLVKSFEYKTFLKVGNTDPNQKTPTPFIIEWIPNVLPKTHVGELRIKFEYGQQSHDIIESCEKTKESSDISLCI